MKSNKEKARDIVEELLRNDPYFAAAEDVLNEAIKYLKEIK